MTETPDSFGSVLEAAVALNRGEIDEDRFVAAVVSLPRVKLTPMPEGIHRGLCDTWVRKDDPVEELRRVLGARLISPATYDTALNAMAHAGHQA